MAVKSEIWVQALVRRSNAQGLFAAVVKRGASEAGAVFIIIDRLDGTFRLLGPAPGPAYDELGERRFIDEMPQPSHETEVAGVLARRRKFDEDIWIVEVADRNGTAGIPIVK